MCKLQNANNYANMADISGLRVECSINFVYPSASNSFVGAKERCVIFLKDDDEVIRTLSKLKEKIIQICGIRKEAITRGLGENVELKIAKTEKTKEGTKAYNINTDEMLKQEVQLMRMAGAGSVQGSSR